MNIQLIKPSITYKESFEKFVLDYFQNNELYYYHKYQKALTNFEEFIKEVTTYQIIEDTQTIITNSYWFIVDDNVVGVCRFRDQDTSHVGHIGYDISPSNRMKGYGTLLLKEVIKLAKTSGYEDIIVTCEQSNLFSKRVIEKNGGVYLDSMYVDEEDKTYLRFKINT